MFRNWFGTSIALKIRKDSPKLIGSNRPIAVIGVSRLIGSNVGIVVTSKNWRKKLLDSFFV